jgi:hypothetical protein
MIFGYILAGLGLLFGFGSSAFEGFEHHASGDIARSLNGHGAKVSVETRAVGLNALGGHFKRVTIHAKEFSTPGLPLFTEPELSKGGKIDELRLDLSNFDLGYLHVRQLSSSIFNCRYDFGLAMRKRKIRLSQSGEGMGSVTINIPDLERFILKKYHEIKSVHVAADHGHVHVWGYGEFIIIHTNFDVTADLVPSTGYQFSLANATITFDGHAADEVSKNALLTTLNPVVDLKKDLHLYDAIFVNRIVVDSDSVTASGITRIPTDPDPSH